MRFPNGPGSVSSANASMSGTSAAESRVGSRSGAATGCSHSIWITSMRCSVCQRGSSSAPSPEQRDELPLRHEPRQVVERAVVVVGHARERADLGRKARGAARAKREPRVRADERAPDRIVQRMHV